MNVLYKNSLKVILCSAMLLALCGCNSEKMITVNTGLQESVTLTMAPQETPTPEPTMAPQETLTPEPIATATPEPTATATPEPTATATPEPIATPTPEPIATATPEPTATATPEPTMAPQETLTPGPYDEYDSTYREWWFRSNTKHETPSAAGNNADYNINDLSAYYVNPNVAEGDKVFYLTFDAGYEYGLTDEILDILAAHNAKAIFFVTKSFIRDETELVIRMKEEGHMVGNHTCKHPNLGKSSVETVIDELTLCAEYMKEKTGYEMDLFVRPPEGGYNERTLHVIHDLGYRTIFWSMAYLDWDTKNQPGKEYVVNYFKRHHHNGAIPLIHVQSTSNEEALDDVLTFLEQEGYRFGLLTELE